MAGSVGVHVLVVNGGLVMLVVTVIHVLAGGGAQFASEIQVIRIAVVVLYVRTSVRVVVDSMSACLTHLFRETPPGSGSRKPDKFIHSHSTMIPFFRSPCQVLFGLICKCLIIKGIIMVSRGSRQAGGGDLRKF